MRRRLESGVRGAILGGSLCLDESKTGVGECEMKGVGKASSCGPDGELLCRGCSGHLGKTGAIQCGSGKAPHGNPEYEDCGKFSVLYW
jgi:hypothetical protein